MNRQIEPQVEAAIYEYGVIEEEGGYGIRVDAATRSTTCSKTVHGVTHDLGRALALMRLLWKRGVSPVGLEDALAELTAAPQP